MIYFDKYFSIFPKFLPAKQKYVQIALKLYSFLILKDFAFSMLKTYKTNFKIVTPDIAEEPVYSSTDF